MMNRDEWRDNVIGYSLVVAVVIGIVLGVWWLLWQQWTWVLPQLWPTGPDAIIHPSYWLFVGMLLIASLIGRTLFGGRSNK